MNFRSAHLLVAGLGSVLAFAGCTAFTISGPESEAGQDLDWPESWKEAGAGNSGKISTGWLKTFRDTDLDRLVDEALENNRNLQAAAARLSVAKEQTVPARANRLPEVGFRGNQSRTRDENGLEEAILRSNYQLGINASWELDVWGRLRDLDQAAQADFAGAKADFRSARLSLAADTAIAWFNYITTVQLADLAETTRDSFERNNRITERNYKAGDDTASPLNVQFGRSNVASAERSLVRARLNQEEAARNLEILIGRYPSAEVKSRSTLPVLPNRVPAGIPSDLLWRRPDLAAAAAELLASAKRADAARKDLLPSINLNGGVTSSGAELSSILLDPDFFVWTVASSLAQHIYEGGVPSAAARQALAQNEVAVRRFADLALLAFQEVESALATEASLAEQEAFLNVELAQANLAETQASRDYSEGLVGILSLLEAQRRAVSARTDMIQLRNQRLRNRVNLHLALGGDFETEPPEEP